MDFQKAAYRESFFMLRLSSLLRLTQRALTAQKNKFHIKDFFSKCDQIRRKLLI